MQRRRKGFPGRGLRIPCTRVGKYELADFMRIPLSADRYSQQRSVGEIYLRLQAGQVLLREERFRAQGPFLAPFLNAALKRPQVGPGELSRTFLH